MDTLWTLLIVVALLGLAIAWGATDIDTTMHYIRVVLVKAAELEAPIVEWVKRQ